MPLLRGLARCSDLMIVADCSLGYEQNGHLPPIGIASGVDISRDSGSAFHIHRMDFL